MHTSAAPNVAGSIPVSHDMFSTIYTTHFFFASNCPVILPDNFIGRLVLADCPADELTGEIKCAEWKWRGHENRSYWSPNRRPVGRGNGMTAPSNHADITRPANPATAATINEPARRDATRLERHAMR